MNNFFEIMAPYATRAAAGTGLDVGVILAQWNLETGGGTSDLCRRANNYAGITWWGGNVGHKDLSSGYAAYDSIDQFVDDYIQTMHQHYYTDVLKSPTVLGQIAALGSSPWAESHYAYAPGETADQSAVGIPGHILNDIYYANNLGQFSGASSTPSAPSGIDSQTMKLAAIGAAAIALFALMKD